MGLNVYMPDFYRDRYFDAAKIQDDMDGFKEFLKSVPEEQIKKDVFESLLPHVEKEVGDFSSLGIAGFCWGSIPVFLCCQNKKFDYGLNYHPSLIALKHVGQDPVEFGKKTKAPQLLILSK